jgi:hypothetical protein
VVTAAHASRRAGRRPDDAIFPAARNGAHPVSPGSSAIGNEGTPRSRRRAGIRRRRGSARCGWCSGCARRASSLIRGHLSVQQTP